MMPSPPLDYISFQGNEQHESSLFLAGLAGYLTYAVELLEVLDVPPYNNMY